MGNIKLLDVTLRDGGIVNNFEFGDENMLKIKGYLEDAGIKNIELGYLEKNTGTEDGRSQFLNEKAVRNVLLKNKKPGVKYYIMADYSKFDVLNLEDKQESGVDCIRFAFHKRNIRDALPLYQKIIDKGYEVYMQPMVTAHYTDEELIDLINEANKLDIKGIYIVDTFGQMYPEDVKRYVSLFDKYLRNDIAIGFHAHNNIQMAYANVLAFIAMDINHDKMIDASIMGMGRGAGNLTTELILKHLGNGYSLNPILKCIDEVMNDISRKYRWGYSTEYILSSLNDVSPIYSKYYKDAYNMSNEELDEILKHIVGENRISFKKDYADLVYKSFKK